MIVVERFVGGDVYRRLPFSGPDSFLRDTTPIELEVDMEDVDLLSLNVVRLHVSANDIQEVFIIILYGG